MYKLTNPDKTEWFGFISEQQVKELNATSISEKELVKLYSKAWFKDVSSFVSENIKRQEELKKLQEANLYSNSKQWA